MSLGVVIKGPEGVVLAADSRVTLEAQRGKDRPISVHFDNSTKLLSFNGHPYVGAVTYGGAVVGLRTAHSYIPEFENELSEARISVNEFALRLSEFFLARWNNAAQKEGFTGADMIFIVGGYSEGQPYGEVSLFSIPNQPNPEPRNAGANEFGMTWGGQMELATRLINGYDPMLISLLKEELKLQDGTLAGLEKTLQKKLQFPIPYQVLPLQDCVNLATLLIRTTISAQSVGIGIRGVGGPIDVATITRTDGLQSVQAKKIQGERL